MKLSGLTDIESMSHETRNSAHSGSPLGGSSFEEQVLNECGGDEQQNQKNKPAHKTHTPHHATVHQRVVHVASPLSHPASDVRFQSKADMLRRQPNVRLWGQSGHSAVLTLINDG